MKKLISILIIIITYFPLNAQVKFTFPVGGENFIACEDTLITWEGNVPSDTLSLEYSLDGGKSWQMLADKPTSNSFLWKNIPNIIDGTPLFRIIRKSNIYINEDKPHIEWSKTYKSGSASNTWAQHFIFIRELPSGNFIAVGKKKLDIWIIKINQKGKLLFSKTYGSSGNENISQFELTDDGGMIISGFSFSASGDFKDKAGQFLMKLDTLGNLLWINSNKNKNSWVTHKFCNIEDNSVVHIQDTIWLRSSNKHKYFTYMFTKVDKDGNTIKTKVPDLDEPYSGHGISQTKDGGYIVCGKNYKSQDKRGFLHKYDSNFNLKWKKEVYSYNDGFNRLYSVLELEDGSFLAMGETWRMSDIDVWCVRIDASGELIWSKRFGGSGNDDFYIHQDNFIQSDSNYYFVTGSESKDGDVSNNYGQKDAWFVKMEIDGNIIWDMNFGGSLNDELYSVQRTSDKGFILAGGTNSSDIDIPDNIGFNAWILKLSVKYQDIDTVIVPFNIVRPSPKSHDIDMLQCYINESKDSLLTNYITNIGDYKFRVDSIYITGADASAFSLVSGFPKYNVEPNEGHNAEFRFTPSRIGGHKAEIVIITQAETLTQNIIGEGIKKLAEIDAEVKAYADLICDNITSSELSIKNTGDALLKINEINILGDVQDDFSFNTTLPLEIQGDSIKIINIEFAPKTTGTKTAQIEIISNAAHSQNLTLDITARKDSIALVPEITKINFGYLLPYENRDTIIKINNLGTILTDGTAELSSNLSSTNSNFSIEPAEFHNLQISFVGISDEGNFTENIKIKDNICNYSREIILTGIIEAPQIELKKPIFGNTLLCDTQTENLNISNPTDATPVTVFLSQSTITGLDADAFSFGINDALLIEPQNNIEIPINFNPTEVKDYEANINLKIEYGLDTTINISGVGVQIVPSTNPNTLSMQLKKDYTFPFIVDIPQTQKGYIDNWKFEIIKNNDVVYFKENSFNPVEKAITWDTPIETANGKMTVTGTGKIDVSNGYVGELFNLKYAGLLDELTTDDIFFNVIYNCDTIDFNVQTINIEEICNANLRLINYSENGNNILSPYPNPITNTFVLNYSVAFDNSAIEIELINAMGQTVKTLLKASKKAGEYSEIIDISKISSGLYYIKYTNGKFVKTVKVMIKK